MSKSPLSFWLDGWQTAFDAAVTIERRFAFMTEAAQRGTLLSEPELWRMGPEKVVAAMDGMTAAWVTTIEQMQAFAAAPGSLPLSASAAIVAAAIAPARRRARANARRLVRRRPKAK